MIKIEETLYFGNTGQLKNRLRRIEKFGDVNVHPSEEASYPPIKGIVLDIENMKSIDATSIKVLIEIVEDYHDRGVEVCFSKLKECNVQIFESSGMVALVGEDHFFQKTLYAVDFITHNEC